MYQTNRTALLAALQLARPALSTQSFIPAWTHLLLDDGFVTAYNDTTLISVRTPLEDVSLCVPGELFIKTLSSFGSESVVLQDINDGNHILVQSGKSKVKVPTLEVSDFRLPKSMGGKPWTVDLSDEILKGIAACRFSAGADQTHPAQMGVTLGEVDGFAVLYSTDNITISRFATGTKIALLADSPVILPSFFCDQVAVLAKAFPADDVELDIYAGAVVVRFGGKAKNATIMTKTLVDLEPLDFETIIGSYLNVNSVKSKGGFATIPPAMDAAFGRALLVLSRQDDKSTRVTVNGDGEVILYSRSDHGEADDAVEWVGKPGKVKPFHIDPALVMRAAKSCGSMAFYDKVLLLASDDGYFLHLVAHCNG